MLGSNLSCLNDSGPVRDVPPHTMSSRSGLGISYDCQEQDDHMRWSAARVHFGFIHLGVFNL